MATDETSRAATHMVDVVADRAAESAPGADDVLVPPPTMPPADLSPHARHLLDDAHHHLGAAAGSAQAGTDIPDDARLRQVKRAVITAMRPVTSHQVPFNADVLAALERLAGVVEEIAVRLGAASALEERHDEALRRLRAAVATVEVQIEDLDGHQEGAASEVVSLRGAVEAVSAELADLRRQVASARSREDVVLRALRDGAGSAGEAVTDASVAADRSAVRRLAQVGRPATEVVVGWAREVEHVVASTSAPVLDLASDRGEWLDVWADLEVEARGVDDDELLAAALRERGHDVVTADPVAHLAATAPGSLGAVTAAVLADVAPLGDLVRVVDAALVALRPGGVLVLAAAHPLGAAPADLLWADPRRRPLHPEALAALAVDRGYAEVEVVALEPGTGETGAPRVHALVARTAGGGPRSR